MMSVYYSSILLQQYAMLTDWLWGTKPCFVPGLQRISLAIEW